MAAPRRVFVKIRDFSQDSAALRPKPPSEPRPLLPSRLADVRTSSKRLPVLPSIPKLEQPARRRPFIKSASPSRLEDAAILHFEEVCNPYELEEGPKAEQRLGKGSFAQKVDLRRGSFSKKQIVSPRRQAVSLAPQVTPKLPIRPEESLPVSPPVSSRNLRIAQISRCFVISKESLEQRNSKHRTFLSEPIPAKPVKPSKSQSVEPPPYMEWLDSLHEVTRVQDFALKVKPAFVPKRRVKLTR